MATQHTAFGGRKAAFCSLAALEKLSALRKPLSCTKGSHGPTPSHSYSIVTMQGFKGPSPIVWYGTVRYGMVSYPILSYSLHSTSFHSTPSHPIHSIPFHILFHSMFHAILFYFYKVNSTHDSLQCSDTSSSSIFAHGSVGNEFLPITRALF